MSTIKTIPPFYNGMKKIIYIAFLSLFISCGNDKPQAPERLPENELPAYREAIIKMAEYIVIEDSAYHFTITKERAVDLDIPTKYYDRMQQELDFTNYIIKEEYNKKGIPIEMPEYRVDSIF